MNFIRDFRAPVLALRVLLDCYIQVSVHIHRDWFLNVNFRRRLLKALERILDIGIRDRTDEKVQLPYLCIAQPDQKVEKFLAESLVTRLILIDGV
jgi:hypothetical protein